jgi:signal transduction histidine kinase
MTNGDYLSSSSTEISLTALLEAQSDHPRADHLAQQMRLISTRVAASQRAKEFTRALVEELPADIACIYLDSPSGMTYVGGMERQSLPQEEGRMVLRQPGQPMRHRLHRIAMRERGSQEPRQRTMTRPNAAWQAYLTIPLQQGADQPIGYLVVGRRKETFAPDDVLVVGFAAQQLPAALADVAQAQMATADQLSVEALQSIIQAANEGILLLDSDFRIRLLNPAFQTLTGWDAEVLGQTCMQVIRCHDDQGIAFCGTVRCPLYHAAIPLASQPILHAQVRIDLHQQPEREMNIGAALVHGNERALLLRAPEASNAPPSQRDVFLSELAHKLRNRFNSINGFMELVATDHINPITASQKQMLSYAHNSSLELLEYIENLLYLTRNDLGQAPLMLDTLAVPDLLEEVEQHLALEAAAVPLRFVRDAASDLPPLRVDHTRLRQAIMNLVTNAIKFTPPEGEVRLAAHLHEGMMVITVADSGIGIAAEDLPHIFARDYSSERTAKLGKNGGGMGLAAAKAIVEQHGGTLTCVSKVHHGTTFTLRLPLADAQ